MTKQDLLTVMASKRACDEATNFVRLSKHDSAEAIWRSCTRVDWLCWLAFRFLPVGSFAFECADRAVRIYAPGELRARGFTAEADRLAALPPIVDRATALAARSATADAATYAAATTYAAAVAADAYAADAYAAATYVNASATYAADAYAAATYVNASAAADAERALQLKHLHGLWPALVAKIGVQS